MGIRLDRLPRAVRFIRCSGESRIAPEGFPVLVLLDQTKLPYVEEFVEIADWRQVVGCIKRLVVRGAPAIGIAGAAAVALRAAEYVYAYDDDLRESSDDFERVFIIDEDSFDPDLYRVGMEYAAQMIKDARPTAVNLAWAVDGCVQVMNEELADNSAPRIIADRLFEFVNSLIDANENSCRKIGGNGSALLPDECSVLTHCNAGSLATAFYGTALGIVYAAAEEGKIKRVYADETRPVNQGARLTVWELSHTGVPVTLICDDMAASVMSQGLIDAVIVGADRIAANGDVANKIGTLGVAILAKYFGIPFYVAAPNSTIDLSIASGASIPIEERSSSELLPEPIDGVDILNPAFDVTPADLITSIITEAGVYEPSNIADSLDGRFV